MLAMKKRFIIGITSVLFIFSFLFIYITSEPPRNFPKSVFDFHVSKDSSLTSVSKDLYDKHIISSPFLFKIAVIMMGSQRVLFAGDYRFTKSQNSFLIAYRMTRGIQGLPKIKVTIPEGTNVYDMAYIYMTKLPNFNAPYFVSKAIKYEGYLFPDTYHFLSNADTDEIIKTMKANFDTKIKTIEGDIKAFNKPIKDIITMSSIVEEESNNFEDRRIVAGILWKRIDKNMFLQVDPPFYYITGKTNGVTYDDLKIDSPYNTYKNKGLPIAPISNPGLEAIKATVTPISTPYYFYLTSKNGTMKYSADYDGHLNNKNIYLK